MWLTLDYLSDFMYMLDMVITVHTGKYFHWVDIDKFDSP